MASGRSRCAAGVGGGGFQYMQPRHKQMSMKDNSLDDMEGRLRDLELLGVDVTAIRSHNG